MLGPDLAVILPEIVLSLFAMGALLGAVYTSKDGLAPALTWGTALLLAIMGAYIALTGSGTRVAFEGMFVDDAFARFAKVTILWSAAAVLLISQDYMTRNNILRFEYPVLVILAVVGMMVMVSAGDLIALYMGLELQSLSLYVIASLRRDSVRSTEAGLKYFILGALSSGLLLFGASLVYGFAGTTQFTGIIESAQGGELSIGLLFGLVFVSAGLAFKVSAAPFHMWTPDVYEGSPTAITALFATAPKVAAMALFARVVHDAFGGAVGRLAADRRLPVGPVDVPRRHRRDRADGHQAPDGLFLDLAHGLRAHGARLRHGAGGRGDADLHGDLRDDEYRHLRLHPDDGKRRPPHHADLRALVLRQPRRNQGAGASGADVLARRCAAARGLLRKYAVLWRRLTGG
jgi:hypothetical protein